MVEIRKAEYLPSNGKASMLDSALASLADRAKIKPIGMVAGETPSARLARAQFHVHRGDLANTVAELDQLRGCQVRLASERHLTITIYIFGSRGHIVTTLSPLGLCTCDNARRRTLHPNG